MHTRDELMTLRQDALRRIEARSPDRCRQVATYFAIGWSAILHQASDVLAGAAEVWMKEKWGRIDITIIPGPGQSAVETQEIEDLIEETTGVTCILTGQPGHLRRGVGSNWARTLSDEAVAILQDKPVDQFEALLYPEHVMGTKPDPDPGLGQG